MAHSMTREEWEGKLSELKEEAKNLDTEFAGARFTDEAKDRYNSFRDQIAEAEATIEELKLREEQIKADAGEGTRSEAGATFQASRPRAVKAEDIWDLDTVPRSWDSLDDQRRELRDRSLRAIEGARFAHPALDPDEARTHLEHVMGDEEMAAYAGGGDLHSERIARHLLATGSPGYKRAFTKYMQGAPRTAEEEGYLYRAMSLTGASGGVAVPFVLDPTLLPSYNGAVNPYRGLADVRTITVDEWRGVTSGGITAAYQAEAAAVTDQSPTLASVSISTEMARVFIPYSIEIGMDWSSFASDMAQEIQNSKDVLEATKFAVGSGTNEPFGVVTGATTVFTAADTDSIVVADIYGVFDALPPLYRSRANWTMANGVLSKIRQLDTAGGSSMLTPSLQVPSAATAGPNMQDARAAVDIFGKGVYEASGQASAFTTGQLIAVVGAYNPYFKIIDRVGLTVENIPHIFGAAQGNLPTGQRGLFAFWRNGSKVVAANAFRTLKLA